MLLVGSHADEAESAAAAIRSCGDVLQRLCEALAAEEGQFLAELEGLDPSGELRRLHASDRGELSAEARQVARLGRLLASPLRLSERALAVSSDTLQNIDLLRERLLEAAFDKSSFAEFGSEQPWTYAAVAGRLGQIAAAGSPSLTWAELQDRLQSMREPPAGMAIKVECLGSSLEGTYRVYQFQLSLDGVAVLTPRARYSEWSADTSNLLLRT